MSSAVDNTFNLLIDDSSLPKYQVNDEKLTGYLTELKWPRGLIEVMKSGLRSVPLRYFVIDDSGSMNESDGSKIVYANKQYKQVPTTRWNELIDGLKVHVGITAASGTVAEFRFLNNAAPLTVSPQYPDNQYLVKTLLDGSPGGGTPLCHHVREVIQSIRLHADDLKKVGKRACVIISTDGEASDGDITAAMKPLETLPCFVVIRLCTNDEKVVSYWNEVDKSLEVEIDILDDISSEAKGVFEKNDWFTYGEPLHRVREHGIPLKELDLLDEKTLIGSQIQTLTRTILGGGITQYPNPDADPKGFLRSCEFHMQGHPLVYDPVSKTTQPWIKIDKLKRHLPSTGCCTIL